MKRVVCSLLLAVMLVATLAACSGPSYVDDSAAGKNAISVLVKIIDGEEKVLFDGKVDVKSDAPTAYMATVAALRDKKLSYSEVGGVLSDLAGVPDVAGAAWFMTRNGSPADSSAAVGANDKIEWKYETAEVESSSEGQKEE